MGKALRGGSIVNDDFESRVRAAFVGQSLQAPLSTSPERVAVVPTDRLLAEVVVRLEEVWTPEELAQMSDERLAGGVRMVWELVRWSTFAET